MTTPEPRLVEIVDVEVQRNWRKYERSGMASLISSYNLCNALFALAQTSLRAKLRADRSTPAATLLEGVDYHLGEHLLHYLAIHGVVEADAVGYRLTVLGDDLMSDVALAQLGAYREAYGPVFNEMTALLSKEKLYGADVSRNGSALSRHSAVLFHTFHTPIVVSALRDLGASCVLDLGCGAGRSLVDACHRDPELRGIGLDISPDAIEVARRLAYEEGLTDRLEFVVGDAFRPDSWPDVCGRADALLAVGVMHEHFREGEAAVIELLNVLAELMRQRIKGFVLGEPELRYDVADNDPDFYLAHIFTGQGFPLRCERWLELFPQTELECRRVLRRAGGGPRLVFYDLAVRE